MSKKKLLEFGLKEADAFQKNFKIIFDRLVRGYRSMMGKDPEGLDLLKVKMEAREKALNTTKVVNQKGLTLDPDKPIVGGTQEGIPTIKTKFDEELDEFNLSKDDPMGDLEKIVKGEGDTGLPKGKRPFGDNIRDAYREAGRSREDATEMIEALDSPGAKKSYEIMEEALGVRLYGDETFEELMQIKETGVHPRGEPPIKKADGGQVPAAPSQLVSESDMILGYRGPGGYQGGRDDRSTASDTGPGGAATDTGPGFTGDSIGPTPSSDLQEIFVATAPQVNPNLAKKGPNIISAPDRDPRFSGYTPSTAPFINQTIGRVKNFFTSPRFAIPRQVGLSALGFVKPNIANRIRQGLVAKELLDSASVLDDTVETDVTGQTTALYKDGGLATMFVEKR